MDSINEDIKKNNDDPSINNYEFNIWYAGHNFKEIYKRLFSAKDKDELQRLLYSISCDQRIILVNSPQFLSLELLKLILDNNIKLFNETEFIENSIQISSFLSLLYINNDIYDLNLFSQRPTFANFLDASEDYIVDTYLNMLDNTEDAHYGLMPSKFKLEISKIENAKKIIDRAGIKEFIYQDHKLSDDVIEFLIENYKLSRDLKNQLLTSFKTPDKIEKCLKKFSLNKYDKDSLILKLPDEYLIKHIHFPSSTFTERVSNLSSDELKEEYLKKYRLLLPPSSKYAIICSFKSFEYLSKYINLFKSDFEKAYLIINSKVQYKNPELLEDILKSINSQYLIYKIYNQTGWFNKICLSKLQDSKYINKILKSYGFIYPISIYSKASENAIKYHIVNNVDIDTVKTPTPFLYLKDINFLLQYLPHTQFDCEYSSDYLPLINLLANHYNLNVEHLIRMLEVTNCGILSLISNNNIQNAINLDDDSFDKYIKLFDKNKIESTQSSISSILNAMYSKEFNSNNPQLNLIFSNILHDVANGNIKIATNRIEAVLGYNGIKSYLTPEAIIQAIKTGDQNIINEFKTLCNSFKVSKRNDFVNKNIIRHMDKFVIKQYDINPLVKEIFYIFPTNMLIKIITDLSEESSINHPILSDERLLTTLIDYKKKNITQISDEDKQYYKDFNILIKELFSKSQKYSSEKRNILIGIPTQMIPIKSKNIILSHIMMNINPLTVKDTILSDDELYKKLLEYIDTYRPLSWVETYGSKSFGENFVFTEDLVSSIINYFALVQNEKKAMIKSGKKMTLAEELDMFENFSSDANIYSYILGDEDYKLIKQNKSPNSSPMSKEKRLERALTLVKEMHKRNTISVPPINKDFKLKNGKSINMMIGNTNDPINLTYGERTGACMRIGGAGEELFDYCLLNQNGFHISYNDPKSGKLVSRVSCYRNGNTVFLNEVRYPLTKDYTDADIIEATRLIGEEIIKSTANSLYPVENIVTSEHYVFMSYEDNHVKLPSSPTKGIYPGIYTDVRKDSAILVATSSSSDPIFKFGPKNSEAYPASRSKIKKYTGSSAKRAVGHIEALDNYLSGMPIEDINTMFDDYLICFTGEDWYVAVNEKYEVVSYVQKNSRDKNAAISEMNQYLELLRKTIKEKLKDSQSESEQLQTYLESINTQELAMEGSARHA